MRLRVDGAGVVTAAGHALVEADALDGLAVAAERAGAGVRDRAVAAGLGVVTEVCSDALHLIARDLELVSARMRAGVRLYGAVEDAVVGAGRLPDGG